MTLALQVAFGTIIFWFVLILLRWLNVQPITADTSRRLAFAAAGLSGAFIGGAYPVVWAMSRNVAAWAERGSTTFTFTGNLPVGVDEGDLLTVIVIGLLILVVQALGEASRAIRQR